MERVFWTMRFSHACLLILLQITGSTYAFTTPAIQRAVGLFDRATNSVVRVSTSSAIRPNGESSPPPAKVLNKKERKELIRKEGGWLSFQTPFGGLNPFGIYYGLTSILLGIPWFFALCLCQLLYFVTGNRVDKQRAIPTFLSHIWGLSLMTLTRCWPKIKNKEILDNFYKNGGAAMIVANHNSWMDIPFVGGAIGWRNYKLVSKKELGKVPILGKSIKVGNHIMVDRSDSKSGLRTLKQGIKYLKDGLTLCTFPEGTRSKSGKLMKFKNGAFKMAHKAQAPVIAFSINGGSQCMPPHWMFPYQPASNCCELVIHEPVESKGKTEDELAAEVRRVMITGLADDHKPDE